MAVLDSKSHHKRTDGDHIETSVRTTNGGVSSSETIAYGDVALYIPGIQTITATVACAIISVISCWIFPEGYGTSIRTLSMVLLVALCLNFKAILLYDVEGGAIVFSALRPCAFIYISSLIVEQLVHTCTPLEVADVTSDHRASHSYWRGWLSTLFFVVMCASGIYRSRIPRVDTDVPLLLTMISLFVISMFPPVPLKTAGPLCAPASHFEALERVSRSLSFSFVYVCMIYSSIPIPGRISSVVLCITRSAGACVWILGVPFYFLPVSFFQCMLAWYSVYRYFYSNHNNNHNNHTLSTAHHHGVLSQYTPVHEQRGVYGV